MSVREAHRLQTTIGVASVPGSVTIDSDAFQVDSLLTGDWSQMDRGEAATRLAKVARIMDGPFLPGVADGWGLGFGDAFCHRFRQAAVEILAPFVTTQEIETPLASALAHPPSARFFGRRVELAQLRQYLLSGERTLTLVGLGGVGKSRLAAEFLAALPEPWDRATVAQVSLGNVVTRTGVLEAILDGLGKRVAGAYLKGRDTLVTVLQAFQSPSILFLDNVEDATLEPGGEVVQLLSYLRYRCPELVMLCTSRCRVGIPEELVVPVSAFDFPSDADLSAYDPQELMDRFPGLEMVLDALEGALKVGTALREDIRQQAGLLRMTGGLPLAIELLAARAAVLNDLPSETEWSAGEFNPTRSIEWALSSVSSEANEIFRVASLFADSFTAEAIEGITGRHAVGYSLSELDDVALLQSVPGDGYLRYKMVPSVRTWALEELQRAGTLDDLMADYARYFTGLLEPELVYTPEEIAPLTVWLSDMVAAVEHYISQGLLARATATADTLGQVFRHSGRYDRGIELMRSLLITLEEFGAPEHCFAEIHDCLGRLLVNAEGTYEATEHLEKALAFWKSSNDSFRIARAANNLGIVADRNQDFETAELYYMQALDGFSDVGNKKALCSLTLNIAGLHFEKQDWSNARHWLVKSLKISEDLDEKTLMMTRLIDLVEAEYLLGNMDNAFEYCKKSFDIVSESKSFIRVSQLSILLGMVAIDLGRDRSLCAKIMSYGLNWINSQKIDFGIVEALIVKSKHIVESEQVELPVFDCESQISQCRLLLDL